MLPTGARVGGGLAGSRAELGEGPLVVGVDDRLSVSALGEPAVDPPCSLVMVVASLAFRSKILFQYSLIWNGLVSRSGSPTAQT